MRRNEREMSPSPPWRTLNNRSASLPRIRLARRDDSSPSSPPSPSRRKNVKTTDIFEPPGVRSWWLGNKSPPRMNSEFLPRNSADRQPPVSAQRNRSKPSTSIPVLTMALLKLDELMLDFTKHLSDPSMSNVEEALALLDGCVATASPNATPSKGSPDSRSPIRDWLTGNTSTHSNDSPTKTADSALVLEGEFENFSLSFFLLAAAEAVYAKLGHVQVDVATQLATLYQQAAKELEMVRETLCVPFLSGMEQLAPNMTMYKEHASSLSRSIQCLLQICAVRSQMISIEVSLWESSQPTFEDLKVAFFDLLSLLPKDASHAEPVRDSVQKEIKLWASMMDLGMTVERCM